MAREVTFKIKIDDNGGFKKVTMDAEELRKAVRSVQDESEKVKRSIISWAEVSQAFDVMQNAIGELQSVMTDLTGAYQVQLVAETQLNTIMRQRMGATDDMIQSVKDLCSAQQALGVIGDEVQLSGAQQMATFLKEKQSLDVLIPAMNNLLAQQNGLNATNQDAVSIGNMMGKAMQGQVEVLQRVGITFDDAQKQVLQFGTESERAATLAQVITDNVGNMNAELAKTDAGKQKQLENNLGDIKEEIGQIIQKYSQLITVSAQLTTVTTGLIRLYTTAKSVAAAFGLGTIAMNAWNATSVRMNALVSVCSASMRGAAVSAGTLRLAIQGLMIATGVGVAIAALTGIIGQLISSSDDAADSTRQLSEEEQQAQLAHQQTARQIASVRSEMDLNIAKLKDFSGSKEQERKLVQDMNTKYGEAMGYYSTVSQWYLALTANSQAYCNQMINEIRLRELANKAADLQQKQREIRYNEDGTLKKYSTKNKTGIKVGDGSEGSMEQVEIKGTSQLDEANRKLTAFYRQEQAVRKEMAGIVARGNKFKPIKVDGWQATAPDIKPTAGSGTSSHTPKAETPKEEDPLEGSIAWYQAKISELNGQLEAAADSATRKALRKKIADLRQDMEMMDFDASSLFSNIKVSKPDRSALQKIDDQIAEWSSSFRPIELEAEVREQDLERIQGLFNVDLSNFDSVRGALLNITAISDSTAQGLATAGAASQALGGALQQLGADSAAAKAGMMMAAIGQLVLSFAQAMQSASSNWITWLAFGVTGTAQLVSMISTLSQFATGGIVPGSQKTGDNVLVRVNSGEMILNAAQQARLFAMANGSVAYGASAGVQGSFAQGMAVPVVSVQTERLQNLVAKGGDTRRLDINMKLRARDLVGAIANETRTNRKRSNIR